MIKTNHYKFDSEKAVFLYRQKSINIKGATNSNQKHIEKY
jgi:hypothetical protein